MRNVPSETLIPVEDRDVDQALPLRNVVFPALALAGVAGVAGLFWAGHEGVLESALTNHSVVTPITDYYKHFAVEVVDGEPRIFGAQDRGLGEKEDMKLHVFSHGTWTALPPFHRYDYPILKALFMPGSGEPLLFTSYHEDHRDATKMDVFGAAWLYRNGAWQNIGLFNEGFPFGCFKSGNEVVFYGSFDGINDAPAAGVAAWNGTAWRPIELPDTPEKPKVEFVFGNVPWKDGVALSASLTGTNISTQFAILYLKDGNLSIHSQGVTAGRSSWEHIKDIASFDDELYAVVVPAQNSSKNVLDVVHWDSNAWRPSTFTMLPVPTSPFPSSSYSLEVHHDARGFIFATDSKVIFGPFQGEGIFEWIPDGRYQYPLALNSGGRFVGDDKLSLSSDGQVFMILHSGLYASPLNKPAIYKLER